MFIVDETRIQKASDRTIRELKNLTDHVAVINETWELLDALRLHQPHDFEDDLVLLRLGIRLFNTSAAATKLARCGYYQPAFTMVRDLMETELLLDLFSRKRKHFTDWRTLPERERMKRFNPAKVRTILDDLDGFVERKRERAYSMLSSYAAHPTPEGWIVISPDNMTQIGPLPDSGRLQAAIEEIVRHLPIGAINLCRCLDELQPRAEAVRTAFDRKYAAWRSIYGPRFVD
jgi:hypothetical protein